MEPTNTLFTKENIPDYFFNELKAICQRDEVLDSLFENFLYCYNKTLNTFILGTQKFICDVYYNSKGLSYCSIPTSRILNVFAHHRWSLGDFLLFDLSTQEEIFLTISLTKAQDLIKLKETILSSLKGSKYAPYQITYHDTKRKYVGELKCTHNLLQYYDQKTIRLTQQENIDWFLLNYDEKITKRNILFNKEFQTSDICDTDINPKYDDLTIDELKEQLEKEKLIAELNKLKQQNRINSDTTLTQPKQDSTQQKKIYIELHHDIPHQKNQRKKLLKKTRKKVLLVALNVDQHLLQQLIKN